MAVYNTKTITATSPATASTAEHAVYFEDLQDYQWFTLDATLLGATGGTLDVYLQRYVGTEWIDWLHLPQKAAGSAATRHTIDSHEIESGPVTVGADTTPALAAGKFSCAHPGNRARVLFVAGGSTSAGAAQTVKLTCWRLAGS